MNEQSFHQTILEQTDFSTFFKELGMENADEQTKEKFIKKSLDSISKRMLVVLAEQISDEILENFMNLEDPNEGYEFLQKQGIDMAEIAVSVIIDFRAGLVENMAYTQGLIDSKLKR